VNTKKAIKIKEKFLAVIKTYDKTIDRRLLIILVIIVPAPILIPALYWLYKKKH